MTSVARPDRTPALSSAATQAAARHRASGVAILGWLGFSLLFLYAVLLGGSWLGIHSVLLRMLSLGLVSIGLVTWLIVSWARPAWRPSTVIWPAFALPILALTFSALFSEYQRVGLEYLAWAILVAALYLLLVRIMAFPFARMRIGGLAAILGLVLGTAYVAWVILLWIEWWGLVGEFLPPPLRPFYLGLTWGNPSAVLTVQVLLLVIAAAGLGGGTRGSRATLAALAVVTTLAVILSGSRAGWISLSAAAVIVGTAWSAHRIWSRPTKLRADISQLLADGRVRLGLAIGLVGAIVLGAIFAPGILARFQDGGDGGRLVYYAVALRMFAAAPVLGLGPGTWPALRAAYTESGELDFVIPHAHNIYLHTAAELGLVGLVAGLVAFACVAWLAVVAIRGADPVRRRWAWAGVFAFVYLAFHDLFDYYANMPAVFLLAAIPVAVLDATTRPRALWPARLDRVARPVAAIATVALGIACAAAIVVLARSEAVAFTHQTAVRSANERDWQAARGPAGEAARQDPHVAPYQQTLGLAAAGTGDWETAAAAYLAAASLDDVPANWLGLAMAQERLDASEDVVASSLERALRLGTQQASVSFVAAQIYDRIGRTTDADAAYVNALVRLPELAAADWWVRDPRWRSRYERLLSEAIEQGPTVAWELALMAGDPVRAKALAGGADSGFRGTIIDAWMGDARAIASVQEAADANVFDAWHLSWAARISEHAGERQAAERYVRLVDLGLRGAAQGVEVEVGERLPERDAALGTNSFNYGNYMHRRTSPMDLIVPGLPAPTIDLGPDETAVEASGDDSSAAVAFR